jgi:protein-S-isoprenylcysteine O-methyltransferase Ste14
LTAQLRVPLGFALGAVFVIFARPRAGLLPIGLAIALTGLLIRAWAAGHIRKNETLSITGPYAHVRNPLYVGSFLLATGFAIVWSFWFLLLVVAFFVFVYAPTIREELLELRELFPGVYPTYEANVPLLFPRLRAWQPGSAIAGQDAEFSVARYMRHSEWKASLGFAAGAAWLSARLLLHF